MECLNGSDHESSKMRRPWPTRGCCSMVKKIHGVLFSGTGNERRSYKKYSHNLSRTAEGKRMRNTPRRVFEVYFNTRVKSIAHQNRIQLVWGSCERGKVNISSFRIIKRRQFFD